MVLLIAIAAFLLASSSCYYPSGQHMMYDWRHVAWGYGGVFMWLILLVVIGVVVYFVVRGGKWPGMGGGDTPLDILKKRYARGEITKEDFERMKRELE
mgnify:CR=1 FL=1